MSRSTFTAPLFTAVALACLVCLSSTAAAGSGSVGNERSASAPALVEYRGKPWIFHVDKNGSLRQTRCVFDPKSPQAPTFTTPIAVSASGSAAAASHQRPHAITQSDGAELFVFYGSSPGNKKSTAALHYTRFDGAQAKDSGALMIPKSPIASLVAVGEFGVETIPGGVLVVFLSPLRTDTIVLARYLFDDRKKQPGTWNARTVSYVKVPGRYPLDISAPSKIAKLPDALRAAGTGVSSCRLAKVDADGRTRVAVGLAVNSAPANAKWRNLLFGEIALDQKWRDASASWDYHEFKFEPASWDTLPFGAPQLWSTPDGSIWADYRADRKGTPLARFLRKSAKDHTWKAAARADLGIDGWGLATGVFPSKQSSGLVVFVDAKDRLAYRTFQ